MKEKELINMGVLTTPFMENGAGFLLGRASGEYRECPKCRCMRVKGFYDCRCSVACSKCQRIHIKRNEMCDCWAEIGDVVMGYAIKNKKLVRDPIVHDIR